MGKNVRFFKTRIDKDDTYIIMHKCNFCPFLMIDKENYRAVCGNPIKDKTISDTVKEDIMYYEGGDKSVVLDNCEIPDFCYLSKNLKEEFEKAELRIKKGEDIFVIHSPRTGEERILSEIYICTTKTGEFTYNEHFQKFLEAKKKFNEKKNQDRLQLTLAEENDLLKLEEISKNTTDIIKMLPQYTTIIVGDVCSCCGEKKEDVNRITNNGMCNDCYEQSKTDFNALCNSMINNFRLKRNKDFLEKNYKKIEKYFVF